MGLTANRTSLVVQGLRVHLLVQGVRVQPFSGNSDPICLTLRKHKTEATHSIKTFKMVRIKKKKKSLCKIDDQGKFDAGNRALKVGCSGTTQRDGVGWEMGRGFRKGVQGDTCTPVADSCRCMAKNTTIL